MTGDAEMSVFNFCPQCGARLAGGTNFCPNCGRRLVGEQDQPEQPSGIREGTLVSGTAMDTQGEPLVGAEITIKGVSLAGENVRYTTKTDSSGNYSLRVARGVYDFLGTVTRNYGGGGQWTLRLHPLDNSTSMEAAGPSPIRKDFRWQLTGLRPGADPTWWGAYYGGAIWVRWSSDGRDITEAIRATNSARYVCAFTLTPTGRRIDGSSGEALTVTRTMDGLLEPRDNVPIEKSDHLHDIPIGQYTLTGVLTAPDGRTVPLLFSNIEVEGYQEAIDIRFEPAIIWDTDNPAIVTMRI